MLALRRFNLSQVSTTTRRLSAVPALHTPFPATTEETFVEPTPNQTEITTLPNGVRVASVEANGNLSSFGIGFDIGSRDEGPTETGSSHLIQFLCQKGTKNRSEFRTFRECERMGAMLSAVPGRENTVFFGDVLRPRSADLFRFLAESARETNYRSWEMELSVKDALESTKLVTKDPSSNIVELMHAAAFRNATLGKPFFASANQYGRLTAEGVSNFWQSKLTGPSTCIVGVNVAHSDLLADAEAMFGDLPSTPAKRETAKYIGGDHRIAVPDAKTTSVGIAFEGPSWAENDVFAACVLSSLFGGGSSFSAGGPGKGMHSLLYRNVLGKGSYIQAANAYTMMYSDGGLFGLHGHTETDAPELISLISTQLSQVCKGDFDNESVVRSKNQLKLSMYANLEQSVVVVDDVVRQLLATHKFRGPEAMAKCIDAVTKDELVALARKMVQSKLTFVAQGDLSTLPSYEEISAKFEIKA